MFDDGTAERIAIPAADQETQQTLPPARSASNQWVSVTDMCRATGMHCSAAVRRAWMQLYAVSQKGGTPEVGGRAVRMAYCDHSTDTRTPHIAMHIDDARAVWSSFPALVAVAAEQLVQEYGRYSRKRHADWLPIPELLEAIGAASSPQAYDGMWRHLRSCILERRPISIAGQPVRARLMIHAEGRVRVHVHRDDASILDWRSYQGDGRFLSLRQIVHHFNDRDAWLGTVAEKLMEKVRRGYGRTGEFSANGVRLGKVMVPTSRGLEAAIPVSFLPKLERIVLQVCQRRIACDLERAPPTEADLGMLVDCRELEPGNLTMMPM